MVGGAWSKSFDTPYITHLAPSDYHFIWTLDRRATKNHFTKFFAEKPQKSYTDASEKLTEKFQKLIYSNGQYVFG